ncbi:RDD family protein, partial [Sporichthya sp.]|uniref:RDD family protein n=1 Tax=Sporichthya sp. TaxID=65475 RepID=UPI00180881C0
MSAWGPGSAPGWGPPPSTVPAGARDVVVGEAVALELRLAKLPSRALALIIDFAVMALPLFGIGVLAGTAASNTDEALGAAILLVSLVSVVFGYPVLCETLSRGRSPGKAALGLRVVREDGGPVQFRHALTRALLGILDFYALFGTVAVVVSLGSAKGKRLGDLLAGTVVIRERVPKSNAPPAVMPPHLAAWAATLPVSRLPDVLALEARQVIGRLEELEPEIGESLSRQLAEEMLVALGTSAPGGSDPVSVLSAVLAERRNRELARAGIFPQQDPVGWGPPAAQSWGPPQATWGAPPPPAPAGGQP